MGRRPGASPRFLVSACLALVLLLLAGLSLAPPAHAVVLTQWSLQPASGSKVGTNIPVYARGTGAWTAEGLVPASATLHVDGMLVPRSSYTLSVLHSSAQWRWVPSPALPDGVRTFRVEVSDSAGRLSSKQWSATIAQAPAAAWMAPSAGAVITNGTPTITMMLADNTPGTTLTVVGQVRAGSATGLTVANFGGNGLLAGQVSFTPDAQLAPGTYYLTATVADAAGNVLTIAGTAARMFVTQAPAAMSSLEGCGSCHPGIASAHPTPATTDCTVCHVGYDGDHMEGTEYCEDCHWDGWHNDKAKATVIVISPCTSCHSGARAEVVQHTAESVAPSHVGSCGSCHVEDIVARHAVTPEGSAYAYQCDLCHGSIDPVVVTAIASGDTACSACHGGPASGHESVHTLDRTDGCATCHPGPSLTSVHMDAGLTCDTCHESEDPEVVTAIAADNLQCNGCHVRAGVDYHLDIAVAHTSPVSTYETCSGCHHSWGSNPIRGHDITRHAGGCATCHNAELDLTGRTALCSSCHITEGAGTPPEAYHLKTEELHTATSDASLACARCHETTDVRLIHTETTGCDTCHTGLCGECHSMHNPSGSSLGVGAECARCHTTEGTDYHLSFSADHTYAGLDEGCEGVGCHSASLVDAHAAFVGVDGRYPQYADTCDLCHVNDDPLRVPSDATAACGSCHESADHEAQHEVTLASDCVGCHEDSNLLPYHEAVGCAACHSSSDPAVVSAIAASDKRCEACHGAEPHGDTTALHAATVTSGPVDIFGNDHEGFGSVTWTVPCSLCHASTNLLTAHASDCGVCHSGSKPAESFVTWGKSCSQGACHPGLEHAGDYAHNNYDCEAACHESDWSVRYVSCEACHSPSSAAPTTTSNVQATYVGAATIQFSASNFSFTFSRLDGGPRVGGTTIVVPAPAAGSQTHTIEYWSVSDSGLEEAPHKTASFSVSADTQPPVTTSNAAASYVGPATITLTPSDNGSSPVSGTYWRVNGGPQQSGRTVSVAQPASGTESFSLEYWSVDASGNEELPHKVAEFTITADHTPPTGSITIAAGAEYTRTQYPTIALSAADPGGSGVYQMRFSNDSITWGSWENYSTSRSWWFLSGGYGPKTVYVQFRDRAGNVSTYSDGIYYDAGTPTGSVAINGGAASTASAEVIVTNSVTDAHSGVSLMRFSNNASVWTEWEPYAATKAWTLAVGTGTRYVYVQVSDYAGNVRQFSDSISVAYTDGTPPTGSVSINGGDAYAASTTVTLTLSATDTGGSGLSQMQFSNDGITWTGWEGYATSKSWTLPPGEGSKTIYARFRDGSGNVSIAYSDTIVLDATAPTGSVLIDGDAPIAPVPQVTLTLSATDAGSGVTQMQLSDDGISWTAWEAYAPTREWTLPSGDGVKAVYARFRDAAGNQSVAYWDSIIFGSPETEPPTGSIVISGGAAVVNSTSVTLGLSATDTGGSGVTHMQFSNDNLNWSVWEAYATSKSWTLSAGDGAKTVYVRFRDGAGNVSATYSDGITLTQGTATLAFEWWSYGEADLHVEDEAGNIIASTFVSGEYEDLNWYVTVPAGQRYYLVCDWYDDWEYGGTGGGYGMWSDDVRINPDGILSPNETIIWYY